METSTCNEVKEQVKIKLFIDDLRALKKVLHQLPDIGVGPLFTLKDIVIRRMTKTGNDFEDTRMLDTDCINLIYERKYTDQEGGW